jgi:translation elongation factor EF-1alpha
VTGMALADVGVLVVPAPIGEYEGSIQRVRIYLFLLFNF